MIINAKIQRTLLGFEDHGIFTLQLCFTWEGASQCNPGRFYGKVPLVEDAGTPERCYLCVATIIAILHALKLNSWEGLQGQYVRIEHNDKDQIVRVGHILEDRWADL